MMFSRTFSEHANVNFKYKDKQQLWNANYLEIIIIAFK